MLTYTRSQAEAALTERGFTFDPTTATWSHVDGTVGRLSMTPADYARYQDDNYSRVVLHTPTVLVQGCTQHPNGGTCPHAGLDVPVLG